MDGLLPLLTFAVLFYVMMRFGCGRHMAHGHGEGQGSKNPDTHKDIDPVCGEEVHSTEGYGKMHSERLYRFCSRRCLDAFDAHPELYVNEQKEVTS